MWLPFYFRNHRDINQMQKNSLINGKPYIKEFFKQAYLEEFYVLFH